ncbi:MAG TPA: hypothetical protein VHY10_17945 [Xanthobacteraceae bacterium]|nr:hypothetical protein [Xanthobacteraceae bacterium]
MKNPPPPKPVPFFFVNDTSVSFTYFFNATDPGVAGSSATVPGGVPNTGNTMYRASGSIDHFDVWEYGTNLIHGELNQYGKEDPEQGQPGASGAREFYGFTRSTLGFNELTHTKAFSTFLTNDVGFEGGLTAGTEDNFLASQTTQYVVGLNFDLAIPKVLGTMLVGVMAYKEYAHNEFDACGPAAAGVAAGACVAGGPFSGDRDFKWTWHLEAFNSVPLGGILGSWADAAHIINLLDVTGPKGTGFSAANIAATCPGIFSAATCLADAETKTEVFEDVRLSIDTSKILWGKPGIWDTYVGYRYWFNKFGTNQNAPLFAGSTTALAGGPFGAPGTSVESTAYLGTTYHFK